MCIHPLLLNHASQPVYCGFTGARSSPAIPLGGSALDDGLDKNAQLLQAGVGAYPHPDDTDPQAVVIWTGDRALINRIWRVNLNVKHRSLRTSGEVLAGKFPSGVASI